MEINTTAIEGVLVVTANKYGDDRGYFSETWNQNRFDGAGIKLNFVQDNQSYSATQGTIRGLHFQSPPHAQDKLVRVVSGRIIDVAVDIRQGSPTFAHWVSEELSAENGKQLFVPKGFLHGFATLEPNSQVIYKVTDYYAPECDCSIRFDDPILRIDWQLAGLSPILSAKDNVAPGFADFISPFIFGQML